MTDLLHHTMASCMNCAAHLINVPQQDGGRPDRGAYIKKCSACGMSFQVWYYFQPVGHSKSYAVRSGSAPHVKRWAWAPIKDGIVWESHCKSGFATQEDAEAAALAALAKVSP